MEGNECFHLPCCGAYVCVLNYSPFSHDCYDKQFSIENAIQTESKKKKRSPRKRKKGKEQGIDSYFLISQINHLSSVSATIPPSKKRKRGEKGYIYECFILTISHSLFTVNIDLIKKIVMHNFQV
jgi:hypothetical protein